MASLRKRMENLKPVFNSAQALTILATLSVLFDRGDISKLDSIEKSMQARKAQNRNEQRRLKYGIKHSSKHCRGRGNKPRAR